MAKAQLAVVKIAGALLFVLAASFAWAQSPPPTTPDDQMGFSSYQSYHGGDIDSINLSTGTPGLDLSLLSYPQRSSDLHVGFHLYYNGKPLLITQSCDPLNG